MAVSRSMRRLLRIRNLEEEQGRLELESALGDLRQLEDALKATVERAHRGRVLVGESARSGELPDRLAGIEETRAAVRYRDVLAPRIIEAKLDVVALRQEFLERRIERRQAETLIEETEARDAREADRRGQQSLDDWFGSKFHQAGGDAEQAEAAGPKAERKEPSAANKT